MKTRGESALDERAMSMPDDSATRTARKDFVQVRCHTARTGAALSRSQGGVRSIGKHCPMRVYSRAREAFEALLTRRQPGHWCRSDAEELRAAEAASRRMAGAAVVNGFGKAADLPGVHRGGVWVSQAPRAASA